MPLVGVPPDVPARVALGAVMTAPLPVPVAPLVQLPFGLEASGTMLVVGCILVVCLLLALGLVLLLELVDSKTGAR